MKNVVSLKNLSLLLVCGMLGGIILFFVSSRASTAANTTLPVPRSDTENLLASPHRENEIVIKWNSGLQGKSVDQKLQRLTAQSPAQLRNAGVSITNDHAKRNFSVLSSTRLSTEELLQLVEDLPGVEYAHPNFLFTTQSQTTPWGVDTSAGVKATQAHTEGYTGSGVVVAVIDTGTDLTHEDLDANLWTPSGNTCVVYGTTISGGCPNHGYDFANADNDPTDDEGHGTHVSGTIAAENNSVGVIGVAPNADIMAIKVLDENGSGEYAAIVEGIDFAIDNGADVINMSLGAMASGVLLKDLQDVLQDAENAGVTVVAASGNNGSAVAFIPSGLEDVISVGAVQESTTQVNPEESYNTRLAYFSNFGKVSVVAPGRRINSTLAGGGYSGDTWDGTSMASPHVAGVVALLKEKQPALTPAQIRHIIETTATDLGASGKDEFFGSGLVDVDAALDKTNDSSTKTILAEANWSKNSTSVYGTAYYYDPTIYSSVIPADGTTTTIIRVQVKTEDGDAVASESVSLSTTAGTFVTTFPITTNSEGIAEATLQSAATPGTATVTATVNTTGATDSLIMRFADTLLVTDAGQPFAAGQEGWYYTQALEAAGEQWKMSTQAYPSLETTLPSYSTVVWHSGGYSLNETEQQNIKSFLDSGTKKLFVSGGDIAYTQYYYERNGGADTLDEDIVLADYFHIAYDHYVASDLTFVGDARFDGVGGSITDFGTDNENFPYSDSVVPTTGGTLEGYFCSNEQGALVTTESTYRSAYLSVALETVTKSERDVIVQNIIDFLNNDTQTGGSFALPSRCDSSTTLDDGGAEDPEIDEGTGEDPVPSIPDSSPDISVPLLTNLAISEMTDTTATLIWETEENIASSSLYAVNVATGETDVVAMGGVAEATMENLTPNTVYEFSVYGVYENETLTSPAIIEGATLPIAPPKPTFEAKNRKTITVGLTDPENTGYAFRVELRDAKKELVLSETLAVGENEHTFTDVSAKTTYYIRAQLVYTNEEDEEIASDFSPYLQVTTYTDRPTKLKPTKRGRDVIQLSWKKPKGEIKKYTVKLWQKKFGEYVLIRKFSIQKNVDLEKLRIKKLLPGKSYRLKIRAHFSGGDAGEYSKALLFRTKRNST